MNALRANRLPFLLAALPPLALALNILCQFATFSSLRPLSEVLTVAIFVPPLLFFDWIGVIRWNLFVGDPRLFGSAWAANAVYVLSSSFVLFIAGKLTVRLWRIWR